MLKIRRQSTPTAPKRSTLLDPVQVRDEAAGALLTRLYGSAEKAPDTIRVPVPAKACSLHYARLLARLFGSHAEMARWGFQPPRWRSTTRKIPNRRAPPRLRAAT